MARLRREAQGNVVDITLKLSDCAQFEEYVAMAVTEEWGIDYG